MIIEDTSGINNPSEAGKHTVAFAVLGPGAAVPGPTLSRFKIDDDKEASAQDGDDPRVIDHRMGVYLSTVAKVALDDNNNKRGYELLVTGTGYNDGTTATAYVLANPTAAQWWDSLNCAEMITAAGMTPSGVKATDDANAYCELYVDLDESQKERGADITYRSLGRIQARGEGL